MREKPRLLFGLIILLTILAALVDLPRVIPVSIDTKIPFIEKTISFHKDIHIFEPNFFIGSWHFNPELSFKKGLDLEGGTSVTLKAEMKDVPLASQKSALDSAKAVIEKRVNLLGVSEPVVQTATVNGDNRIIVELPGITDVAQAVSLIGTTAQLTFWEDLGGTPSAELATSSAYPQGLASVFANPHKTELTGSDLEQSRVAFSQNTGSPEVQLVFTSMGGQKFAAITKRNVNKQLAIALDNQVIQAPTVNQEIIGGTAVITGGFTAEQAKAVTIQLNAGALPVPLTILSQSTVGATLGSDSLAKSLFAGMIGFIITVIFMTVLYGRLGILASFALVLYTLFVLALFKLIPVTLTLAGIAGFILSIGMAVDANILIFERMKEEMRRGRPRDLAIELGFSRAWTSIRDSNVSSIITSLILFQFGTGIVRGFALTLLLGVLVSMFSAIIVTRTFLRLAYRVKN